MMSFPPHTTHRMQPFDVAFFKPLKTAYSISLEMWMKSSSYQRAASVYEISRFVDEAYMEAATMATAVNGFRATGLWPPNRHAFDDEFARLSQPTANQSEFLNVTSAPHAIATPPLPTIATPPLPACQRHL